MLDNLVVCCDTIIPGIVRLMVKRLCVVVLMLWLCTFDWIVFFSIRNDSAQHKNRISTNIAQNDSPTLIIQIS